MNTGTITNEQVEAWNAAIMAAMELLHEQAAMAAAAGLASRAEVLRDAEQAMLWLSKEGIATRLPCCEDAFTCPFYADACLRYGWDGDALYAVLEHSRFLVLHLGAA